MTIENRDDNGGVTSQGEGFVMTDVPVPQTQEQTDFTSESSGGNGNSGNGNGGDFVYGNPGNPEGPENPEKHKKASRDGKPKSEFITKKAFVITLIICMLITSALTVTGYNIATNMGLNGTTKKVSATNYSLAEATGSEKSIQEIVAMNENAVVEIRTEQVKMDSWLSNYVAEGAGSGVIIDTKGYILTCAHVVEDAQKITVILKDGTKAEASVVGMDSQNDVAVIKIKAGNLTAATYGNVKDLSVGSMVVAIGNPLGQLGGTATAGIVSALDRQLTIGGKTLSLLQTDASINPGNSGGGLFDEYGHLIGIVVAKSAGSDVEGLGFAIPINRAAEIAKDLIKNGHVTGRAMLGVQIIDATDAQTAFELGVRMNGIYIKEALTPEAKKAGFKEGDLLYFVEDTKIESMTALSDELSKHKPGEKVKAVVIRGDKTIELEVKLTESK